MSKSAQNFCIKIMMVLIPAFFIITGSLYSQDLQYKEYIVQKGDTLWSISGRELNNSFLWPKIWKENPEIKNPDSIYPGQRIRIPIYLIRKEVVIPQAPVIVEKIIHSPPPRIAAPPDYIASRGTIIGSPSERTLFGAGDNAYITVVTQVKTGDRFYIVRPLGPVKHPETGATIGNLIDFRGAAEVIGMENGQIKVRIITAYAEIDAGDILIDFYEIEPPFLIDNPRRPDINGFIIASKYMHVLNARPDFVYIDKGRRDGVEVGDIFNITSRNKYDVPNGYIQIVDVREFTATGIIRESDKEVQAGDRIGPLPEQKISSGPVIIQRPVVVPSIVIPDDVNFFINQYISAYESGDIDRLMSLYSKSAIENGILYYDDIRRAYEKNFRSGHFIYTLRKPQAQGIDGQIMLTGLYTVTTMRGDAIISITQGNIKWILVRENGMLKIIRVDYDKR